MLDIKDMSRVTLREGDVLIVRVPAYMPRRAYEKYTHELREFLRLYFLSNEIIILPENVNINIINKGDNVGIPSINT